VPVTGCALDRQDRDFSLHHHIQTVSRASLVSYLLVPAGFFLGDKAAGT